MSTSFLSFAQDIPISEQNCIYLFMSQYHRGLLICQNVDV